MAWKPAGCGNRPCSPCPFDGRVCVPSQCERQPSFGMAIGSWIILRCGAPERSSASNDAPILSIPMAARPCAVMLSASCPRSSSRRQADSLLPAGTRQGQWRRPRAARRRSSTSCVSVSVFGDIVGSPVASDGVSRRHHRSPVQPN
jgi:hypothetical protein